jgi:hypothetical protein
MVEDGPNCCHSSQRVYTRRRVCSSRQVLVQFGVAKAHLKPAVSFDTREKNVKRLKRKPFVLIPYLYNILHCILHNPKRILKKI